jgi:roadblock/LC7 domain-containing protein
VIIPTLAVASGVAAGLVPLLHDTAPPSAYGDLLHNLRYMAPGIGGSVAAAGLEIWFTLKSGWWSKHFWEPYKEKAVVGANIIYPMVMEVAGFLTTTAIGGAYQFDLGMFVTRVGVNTAIFTASFGAAQVAIGQLKASGRFTELERMRFESLACFWNNTGRVIAGVAMAAGVSSDPVYNTGYELLNQFLTTPALIGIGIQASFGLAITAGLRAKLKWGDLAWANRIKSKFMSNNGKKLYSGLSGMKRASCDAVLAGIARVYSFKPSAIRL